MIFEASPEQIIRLTSIELVQLMKRLLLAECRLVDIPLRAATVPLQITIADGGEDGRVEWAGGLDSTDYLPSRFSVFQSKAQNLTESAVFGEVAKRPKRGRPVLNDAVSEMLAKKGAYVIFCSRAFTGQKIKKLRAGILNAIRECGKSIPRSSVVEIYDANRIADWVNTHPSIAVWLSEVHRGRSVAGFLSQDGWEFMPEIANVPWVDDDHPRFAPEGIVIPEEQRKDANRNTWTFDQAASYSLKFLAEEKVALRISGASGFGKTRFAFELFNNRIEIADAVDSAALVYADFGIVGEEVAKLALEMADSGSPAIMVVDDCPDGMHSKLASIAGRSGSRLRLVSMEVETRIAPADNTLVIRLEPASDKTISMIARRVGPRLSDSDAHLIEQLAKGFPKMAVLAALQGGVGRKTIRSTEELLTRIVWGKRQIKDDWLRALEILALFEWIGISGEVGTESAFVAEHLGQMTHDQFVERVKSFDERGILIKRGDYVQIAPVPLAAAMAAHRLTLVVDGKLESFFLAAPERLKKSLLSRMKWLDNSPVAREFARRMLSPECLGNLEALQTEFGADCLNRFVHVDPQLAMSTIQRVFSGLDRDGLNGVSAGRRHLVWALEKLAFRTESFDAAATLLRRLATVETETRISNNATGQFHQLFQLYLAGTEAPPKMRLLVLDDGLLSTDSAEREVCLGALDKMLDVHHFMRGGASEEIGSGERLQDWIPSTHAEILDFLRAAISRLTAIALSDDPLRKRAKDSIGSHFRGLIGHLPLDEIKATISSIVDAYGLWPEAIQGISAWLYFDRREAPEANALEVRRYFDELMPTDPIESVALYVNGWQSDLHDPDVQYDPMNSSNLDFEYVPGRLRTLAATIATDPLLLDRTVERFACAKTKTLFPFVRRLAELVSEPLAVFHQSLSFAEKCSEAANRDFFAGLVAGFDVRDPKLARECIGHALRSEKLKDDAIGMIGSGKLQRADLELVASLVVSGEVNPAQVAALSYGRSMEHLPAESIVPLLEALSKQGPIGLWTVLDVVSMLLHGGKEFPKSFLPVLRAALVAPHLFNLVVNTMDGHHFQTLISTLVERKLVDQKFARALVKQLLSICREKRSDVFHALDDSVRQALAILASSHPSEVWSAVTKLLVEDDWHVRFHLERILGPRKDDHLGAGVLSPIPEELFMAWVREEPGTRARLILRWLPICLKGEDESLSWHPTFTKFIDEFHHSEEVLVELSSRLYPRFYWGSPVFQMQQLIKLLSQWECEPRAEMRQFSQRLKAGFADDIAAAKRRQDEEAVRYS
jgi:hypothetical protein